MICLTPSSLQTVDKTPKNSLARSDRIYSGMSWKWNHVRHSAVNISDGSLEDSDTNCTHRENRSTMVSTYFSPESNASPGEYRSIDTAWNGSEAFMDPKGWSFADSNDFARIHTEHLVTYRTTAVVILRKKYFFRMTHTVLITPECP